MVTGSPRAREEMYAGKLLWETLWHHLEKVGESKSKKNTTTQISEQYLQLVEMKRSVIGQ